MSETVRYKQIEEKIIVIRDLPVILVNDVAELYEVETREINQAVKNNPAKFPKGYIIEITNDEKQEVIKNFDNPKIKYSPTLPKAFTEKGLYMLATILKGEKATQTTIEINFALMKFKHTVRRKK